MKTNIPCLVLAFLLTAPNLLEAAESGSATRRVVVTRASGSPDAREIETIIRSDAPEADPNDSAAWLGVAVEKVTPLVATQLGLAKGTGLVIEHVVADSPAAQAGFEANDILIRLGDQTLVNPEQLTVLVRSHAVGDQVAITYRHRGEERTAEVRLAARPPGTGGIGFGEVIDIDTEKLKTLVNQQARRVYSTVRTELPRIQNAIRSTIVHLTDQTTVLKDDEGTITVTRKNNRKHLKAEDKDGNVVFDAPIETESDLSEVPPEIRKRMDAMPQPPQFELDEVKRGLESMRKELKIEIENLGRELEQIKGKLADALAPEHR
jgi:hypothetical protein